MAVHEFFHELHDVAHEDPVHFSSWSQSRSKRLFDCACVLFFSPLLLPILLLVALAVRMTSPGPVLFIQYRVGCSGKLFPILKFRTMPFIREKDRHAVTTADNQRFTPIGLFLRHWKLDELPQVINVLCGHMSLVGPRPKLPEHNKSAAVLNCRPGITGAATIAFAREEKFLTQVPAHMLDFYYHSVVLPAKLQLDVDYMSEATFGSDLKLLVDSVLRSWDNTVWKHILYDERKLHQMIQARKVTETQRYLYTTSSLNRANSVQ